MRTLKLTHQQRTNRDYYSQHRDEILERQKLYYEGNEERISSYKRAYRLANPDKLKLGHKNWRLTPSGQYSYLKRSKHEVGFTKNEFLEWYSEQSKQCTYCCRTIEEVKMVDDGLLLYSNQLSIDRKDNEKGYVPNNIVLSCFRCNLIKGNFFTYEQMIRVGELVKERISELCVRSV